MVQQRAIRFICGDYKWDASVSEMQKKLGLPTLEERRKNARLTIFYKAINNLIAIPLPTYITPRTVRHTEQRRFNLLCSSSDIYKYSFFTRTLKDWNELLKATIELPSVEQFKRGCFYSHHCI